MQVIQFFFDCQAGLDYAAAGFWEAIAKAFFFSAAVLYACWLQMLAGQGKVWRRFLFCCSFCCWPLAGFHSLFEVFQLLVQMAPKSISTASPFSVMQQFCLLRSQPLLIPKTCYVTWYQSGMEVLFWEKCQGFLSPAAVLCACVLQISRAMSFFMTE